MRDFDIKIEISRKRFLLISIFMSKSRKMRCPHCGFLDTIKKGKRAGYSRYYCKNCNSYFTDGGGFSVVVFKKSNQDNLHSYGCIPFVEYGHEFCVKE